MPADSAAVVKVADPLTSLIFEARTPCAVEVNVTVPVGTIPLTMVAGVTTAVNVTLCPAVIAYEFEETEVVVATPVAAVLVSPTVVELQV